jgi:hypothetical protein
LLPNYKRQKSADTKFSGSIKNAISPSVGELQKVANNLAIAASTSEKTDDKQIEGSAVHEKLTEIRRTRLVVNQDNPLGTFVIPTLTLANMQDSKRAEQQRYRKEYHTVKLYVRF